MGKLRKTFFPVAAVLFIAGCLTLPKSLTSFQAVDFTQFGAVGLNVNTVTVGGLSREQPKVWYDTSVFEKLDTGEEFNTTGFDYGRAGEMPPGRYVMKVLNLHTLLMPSSPYSNSMESSTIPLNLRSKPFSIAVGEIVYLGKLSFFVGQSQPANPLHPLALIGAAVGVSQQGVQVSYAVEDRSNEFEDALRQARPGASYRFRTQILEFEEQTADR